jgi:tetratricopeptide (TPR) repeat protein
MVDFARSLARRGLREDALLILDLLPAGSSTETADLRARILTQLGRYAEAEDVWQQVLAECPDHPGATEGLAAVATLRKKPLARFRVACALRFRRVATVCVVLLLVGLALVSAGLLWHRLYSLGQNQHALLDAQTARNADVDKKLATVRQDAADLANLQLNLRDSVVELKGVVDKL